MKEKYKNAYKIIILRYYPRKLWSLKNTRNPIISRDHNKPNFSFLAFIKSYFSFYYIELQYFGLKFQGSDSCLFSFLPVFGLCCREGYDPKCAIQNILFFSNWSKSNKKYSMYCRHQLGTSGLGMTSEVQGQQSVPVSCLYTLSAQPSRISGLRSQKSKREEKKVGRGNLRLRHELG